MSIRVYINGEIFGPSDAKVSVFDRGFLYGDSVYETLATLDGNPIELDAHVRRLARSAERIGLTTPAPGTVEGAIADTLNAAGNPESRIRVILTRGEGRQVEIDPFADIRPQLIVIVQPLGGPSKKDYDEGVAVELVSISRNHPTAMDPAIKSGNYLNNVLALREARKRNPDAHEAILLSTSGSVAEAATANVFCVKAGQLFTPSLAVGILDGVTRARVLRAAESEGIPTHEVDHLAPEELLSSDEVFITSSARGVLPVTRIGDTRIGDAPGAYTLAISRSYNDKLKFDFSKGRER